MYSLLDKQKLFFFIIFVLQSWVLLGLYKEVKVQKNKLLLIAQSQNIKALNEIYQSMKRNGYFQDIFFDFEVSLPSAYPEAQEDSEMLSREAGFSDAAVARTFTFGTQRILFFDAFFKKDYTQREIFLLHELCHRVIYDSGVNKDLYAKANTIQNVRVNLSDKQKKRIFERMANHQIGYILSLPDEIIAEKLFYNKWPDLFKVRMKDYLEGDKANLDDLVNNIALNLTGNLDLQKIINRMLYIKCVYLFYEEERESEHLLLIKKYEECVKQIAVKTGFEWEFIFDYIDEITAECTKERIDSDKLIDLFLSYRKDFLWKAFKYKTE